MLLSCGGASPASLLVDLRTDYLPREIREIRIVLEGVTETTLGPPAGLASGARIASFEDLEPGEYRVIVGLSGPDGALLQAQPMRVDVRGDVGVTAVITRNCAATRCPEACIDAVCAPEICTPETPELCPPRENECEVDADCPGEGCVEGACRDGVCLQVLRDDGCDGLCSAEAGCVEDECPAVDADTLALYDFENGLADRVDAHEMSESNTEELVEGPCGTARIFRGEAYLALLDGDDPEWEEVRSFDLYVRPRDNAMGTTRGILSRDASDTETGGHLSLHWFRHRIGVRLQGRNEPEEEQTYRCSPRIDSEAWHHVGVNVGDGLPMELWVDGVLVNDDQDALTGGIAMFCGNGDNGDVTGNTNPWSFGGLQNATMEGDLQPLNYQMQDGVIDHIRFSRVRRDFSTFAD